MPPNFRKQDPPTAKIAGRCARRQRDLCLAAVKIKPGLTAREIEIRLGVKAHKRLPELRFEGLVRNGTDRTCTISGRRSMTWNPLNVN